MTRDSVGVVVPAYEPDVSRLRNYVEAIEGSLSPTAILVELDAPATGLRDRLADLPGRVETAPHRRGKGAAITAGFERLDTDVLAFVDADRSTPVASLGEVLDPVVSARSDLAVGSRRHPDAEIVSQQTVLRQLLGDCYAWIAGRLLSVSLHDYQCGAKAIRADGWERVREHLYEPGFAWDIELVAIAGALDLCVREVPVEWRDRAGSTVDPVRDAATLFRALLAARYRADRLRENGRQTTNEVRNQGVPPLVDR
ncbi:glycosyltransferase [Halorientalis pallida]|uniref:Glycosyltransferase n=1 Tax=Halorientalis pallida TaxID=2479928 RepID=A0A498L0P8_9EURY|nr:glycosyltransferase [Halorientalis pallida]RXK46966.1 glycosyltransferase [Halorientalis pallida]